MKDLAYFFLKEKIQEYKAPFFGTIHGGEHESYTDAVMTLRIFKKIKTWDPNQSLPKAYEIREEVSNAKEQGLLPNLKRTKGNRPAPKKAQRPKIVPPKEVVLDPKEIEAVEKHGLEY